MTEVCTCNQHGNYCPAHPTCVCGCERHAHVARTRECFAGRLGCEGCESYRPRGGELDDDVTPVIDEGLHHRAAQIDWSPCEKFEPNVVACRNGHKEYRSYSRFDLASDRIVAQRPCPECGTHEMRRTSTVEASEIITGEIPSREAQTITSDDVGSVNEVLELDKPDGE